MDSSCHKGAPQKAARKGSKGAYHRAHEGYFGRKTAYAAIAAEEVRPPARTIPPESDKENETASAAKSLALLAGGA